VTSGGLFENGKEYAVSLKNTEILDELRNWWLLKNGFAALIERMTELS
jgi:hypothetical protein